MNPYNVFANLLKARQAGVGFLVDPGSGGTIKVTGDNCVLYISANAGTRTLEAASRLPLGTVVRVFTSIGSVTINSTAMTDGSYLEFVRGVDASGAAEWEVRDPNDVVDDITALTARVAALEAGYPLKTVNLQTGTSYALQESDSGKILRFTNGSAITVDVPTALPAGFHCRVIQGGAGLVTFQGTGGMSLTTESAALTLDAQDGMGEVVVVATNVAYFATFAVG